MVVQGTQPDLVSSSLKSDKKHRLKQRFDVQRKLGQGTYGKVQLAINRETGQEVAIKTIKKNKIESDQDLIRIRREIQIMSSIQHPHIIHIYEVFENKDKIVLVMQFANGGELYDYLSEKKVLSDLEARRIFRQIATAVYYCHKNKICHRDLKLENILLDEKGNAKIADFGLSNVFDEKHLLKTYCGSPLYASPEIVKGVPYYGPEVDCWSMGVLLYTLVYGAMPFDGSNFKKLVTQISEGDYFEPKKKSNASELIRKLLTVNPAKRATIVDICMDCWVNLGYEHSLLQVAEDMANLTPVRLDLLLALAPGSPIPECELEFPKQLIDGNAQESDKDIPDEEDEDDEYNPDTAANSFAFMKGSHASQLSVSSPNLQEAFENAYQDDSETEFLPADIAAALQNEGAKRLAESSFGASLARISSLAHRSKKPRKSDSANLPENQQINSQTSQKAADISHKAEVKLKEPLSEKEKKNKNLSKSQLEINKNSESSKAKDTSSTEIKAKSAELEKEETKIEPQGSMQNEVIKPPIRRESLTSSKVQIIGSMLQKRGSLSAQEEKETKKIGRPPGKIIIPKTFDSPQSTPSPKPVNLRKTSTSESPLENKEVFQQADKIGESNEKSLTKDFEETSNNVSSNEDINRNVVAISDSEAEKKSPEVTEDKKLLAKGILKKGIAKAKLAERRMSKQDSLESDVSTPVSSVGTPEAAPSFFRLPKPYLKEEEKNMKSIAEIKLSSTQNSSSTLKSETLTNQSAPLWDGASNDRYLPSKESNLSNVSSAIDSELIGWREQMEDSLRRLSPDNEHSTSNQSYTLMKTDDDKPLVPIARSYKKFTFTKDGACITETKKIYTTPGADGSWTKVEKKTKITTRPGNAEEFEKFRDLHLRNASPLTRSDSQSSSGSNDVYDDIFDSWTGDTMMCNMRKMNNLFQKFSRDPFLRKERRRNPFRFFRRADSERNERERRHYELRGRRLSDKESSENEEDYNVHFDDGSAAVYGSQGLWQLLRSANRGFSGSASNQHDQGNSGRSLSQEPSESKFETNWKRCGSRASSGYNTGTRSQSRDRMESPREKVLRFVFESPHEGFSRESSLKSSPTRHEKFLAKRNFSRHPRRDSGMGSDGYESEYSVHHSPSDDLSKPGRIPSMSSIYSNGRQDMIRHFMKSWSKEFTSPPMSPTSLGSTKEHLENLSESRKHRVEQWLHMNSDVPFEEPHSRVSSRKVNPSHGNSSPSYATMHPREYLRYNRSSSDKLSNYDTEYFPSFGETYRVRSHSINKEDMQNEVNKMRYGSAYSPVSEESNKETYSVHHSDSSQSSSSIHRINFTFSDGRATSSHTTPQTRFTRSFNNGKDVQATFEATPSANVKFEQVTRTGQPVVQMRVSFNRGNSENQVIHVTSQSPQASKGLWEQQDSPKLLKQELSPTIVRDTSPLPGIRQFSTEVHHPIGNVETVNRSSLECEITNSGKESPLNAQTGNR